MNKQVCLVNYRKEARLLGGSAVKIGTRSLGQCQITAHRGNMDDCSIRAFALKPRRLRRAARRRWGLTARRDRANGATMPQMRT